MSLIRTEGIVLRYADYKEADRLLIVLTPDKGKITVSSRGCRKSKSRLMAGSQLFSYADFLLFRLGTDYLLSQIDLKDSFFSVRNDLVRLSYATYLLNLAEESVILNEGAPEIFKLLLTSMYFMSESEILPEDIAHAFEVKLIDYLGYRPQLNSCTLCNASLCAKRNVPLACFSIAEGGLVCSDCLDRAFTYFPIHSATLSTLKYMLDMDIARLSTLKVSKTVREELEKLLPAYLEYVLDKRMRARKMIDLNKKA